MFLFFSLLLQTCCSDTVAHSRMRKYSQASACNFLGGWIYLHRLKGKVSGLCINTYNFQRLITVATMLAAKFFDDDFYCNKVWAKIGGLTTKELNKLELEMLDLLEWKMLVKDEEYEACRDLLCKLAWGSNVDRGYCACTWSSCPSSPVQRASDIDSVTSSSDTNLYRSASSLFPSAQTCEPMEKFPESSVDDYDYFPPAEEPRFSSMDEWRIGVSMESLSAESLSAVPVGASFESHAAVKSRGIEHSFDSCTTALSQCSTPRAALLYSQDLHRSIDGAGFLSRKNSFDSLGYLSRKHSCDSMGLISRKNSCDSVNLSRKTSLDFQEYDLINYPAIDIHQSMDINLSMDIIGMDINRSMDMNWSKEINMSRAKEPEISSPPLVNASLSAPPMSGEHSILVPGGLNLMARMC